MTMNKEIEATLPDEDLVPEWDLADRMTKSLRVRGISVGAMAEAFGLSRETIGRWLSGRAEPDKGRLYFWATLTGVNLEWLETGKRACRDSNPKPSVLELVYSAERESVRPSLTANRTEVEGWTDDQNRSRTHLVVVRELPRRGPIRRAGRDRDSGPGTTGAPRSRRDRTGAGRGAGRALQLVARDRGRAS